MSGSLYWLDREQPVDQDILTIEKSRARDFPNEYIDAERVKQAVRPKGNTMKFKRAVCERCGGIGCRRCTRGPDPWLTTEKK